MKVAFITPRAKKTGGAEDSLVTLLDYLQRHGVELKVITFEKEGNLLDELDKLGIEHQAIRGEMWIDLPWEKSDSKKSTRIFEQGIEAARILSRWKADLIYTNTSVTNIGAIAATLLNKPHIWHIRESLKDHPSYKTIIPFESVVNYINASSNYMIFISKYLQDQYLRESINTNSKVIYNRVNPFVQKLKDIESNRKVDIIIPFYKDDSILECMESVKKNKSESLNKVYVIDDRGPDLDLVEKVKNFVNDNSDLFVYLQNEENKGFVYTCNKGMELSENDVILLNSDTIVTSNWLEKMRKNIYQDETFATSTALSNSASYYSIPDQFNKEFENDPETMNKIVELFSPYKYIQTHASHGFCMYIKREVIDAIGKFDEEAFGKGYGEEVDFSLRALKNGYKNIVSTNTYIHHWEGRSFGKLGDEKKKIIAKKTKILLKRYPDLHKYEVEFHKRNELADIKKLATYFKNKPETLKGDRLVVVGSIEENKGQMDAVLLLKKLHEKNEKAHLILVGAYDNSPYVQEIKNLSVDFGLEDYIHLIGYIEHPWEIIKSAKVAINPSRSEGFGRAAMEIMLIGTPLISTNAGGLNEFVNNETAYIYEAGNLKNLFEAYAEFKKNKGKKAIKGREKATEIQGSSRYEEEILEIINSLYQSENRGRNFTQFLSPWFYADMFDASIRKYLFTGMKNKVKNLPVIRTTRSFIPDLSYKINFHRNKLRKTIKGLRKKYQIRTRIKRFLKLQK